MTKERLELELLRIKASVAPDYVGAVGTAEASDGRRCLSAELLFRTGCVDELGRFSAVHGWFGQQRSCSCDGRLCMGIDQASPHAPLIGAIISRNDKGLPWHQIIDQLVPQAQAEPMGDLDKTAPGGSAVCEPELQGVGA